MLVVHLTLKSTRKRDNIYIYIYIRDQDLRTGREDKPQ